MVSSNFGNLGFGRSQNDKGKNDDCFTPPEVFDKLAIRFDLDVAAPIGGVSWVPADRYYTADDDALTQEWNGRVWMNPPFSLVRKFAPKFQAHGNGIALVPSTQGKWMHELWNDERAAWVRLDKLRFIKPDGSRWATSMPTVIWLVAYGDKCQEALQKIGTVKR
jgi:hypothetical protein